MPCIAVPHYDKAHTHVHFCISATVLAGKSLRISKEDFANFKKELQEYQMQKYPQLSNSIVKHGKRRKEKIAEREYQLKKRTQAPSEREHIKQTVELCYNKPLSHADFMYRLSQQGLQTYSRNGNVTGIEGERKYRFGSLGFDERSLRELNYRDEALKGIQVFRDRDEKNRGKEIEDDIAEELDRVGDDKKRQTIKSGRKWVKMKMLKWMMI